MEVNQIICGDCLEVMKDWPDNCVDLVLTDPPYGTYDGRGKVQATPWRTGEFYVGEWDKQLPLVWIAEAIRILDKGRWSVIWTDYLELKTVWDYFEKQGGKGKCVYFWIKRFFRPNLRNNFASGVETAVVGTKGVVKYWQNSHVIPNYWFGNSDKGERIGHPTQKPLALKAGIIRVLSDENDLILDPFCGSGTTCVAAKMLGRRYIGIDISEKYCEIARQRLDSVDTGVPVKEQRKGQMALEFEKGI